MNRVSPINDIDLSLNSSSRSSNIHMTDKNSNSINISNNSQILDHDRNRISNDVVITIKEESTSENQNKSESPNQVSAIVKFIRNSIWSNKKKPESVIMNPKLICFQKVPINQPSNQIDNSNSEQSNCNVNLSITSSNEVFCRFCQEYEPESELVTPCLCSGTLKYIHQSCLQRWIKVQDNRFCELCKYEFRMKVTSKPLREWQKLEMSVMEKRKIICSVTFHIIALTCVIWSLYVLIERTTEEIHNGIMEWPLWTKLIVVAIGFIGGVVFMYVQCRMYVSLCRKWHIYNRTFIVQNITPMELLAAQKEAKAKCEDYQKNIQYGRTHLFGDVSIETVPNVNVNIIHAPILGVRSSDEFEFSSSPETNMSYYPEKIFSTSELSNRDHFPSNLNESTRSTTTLVAQRMFDS